MSIHRTLTPREWLSEGVKNWSEDECAEILRRYNALPGVVQAGRELHDALGNSGRTMDQFTKREQAAIHALRVVLQ